MLSELIADFETRWPDWKWILYKCENGLGHRAFAQWGKLVVSCSSTNHASPLLTFQSLITEMENLHAKQ